MPVLRSRRLLLGGVGAAGALWLTGCATVPAVDPAEPATFTNLGPRAAPASPHAKRLYMPVVDAFKGEGLFFFDDDSAAQFLIKDAIRENGRYPVQENFAWGKPHGFSWGTGAVGVLRRSRRVAPESPQHLRLERDGHVVVEFAGDSALELHVTLEAYDVAGMEIRDFLRTRANMPTPAALFMGKEVFPEGAVAYAVTLWVPRDELLAASATAFTGSDTLEAFSTRFTKETPFCLRTLPGKNVMPIGLRFPAPIRAKIKRDRRGRKTELAQKGRVFVYETKKGTIFCQKTDPKPLAEAAWTLDTINGTRTLALDFPAGIDALSFGMSQANRAKLLTAFAEELTEGERRTERRVIPAYLWKKNAPVRDAQYRFNNVAAEAIKAAIKTAKPKRDAWERENESDVTRRARAIQARNAKKASPKRTSKRSAKKKR